MSWPGRASLADAPPCNPHNPFPMARLPATAGEYERGCIVDDRFDRRELLLHLGDVLKAMRLVGSATQPFSAIAHLAAREPSLQALPFLQQMSPLTSARDFLERAATAFGSWPGALLEAELDRVALASTVQRELFGNDPQGWDSYARYVRRKVSWFGLDLDEKTSVSPTGNDSKDENGTTSDPSPARTRWPWRPISKAVPPEQ